MCRPEDLQVKKTIRLTGPSALKAQAPIKGTANHRCDRVYGFVVIIGLGLTVCLGQAANPLAALFDQPAVADLVRLLPRSAPWEEWLQTSGEKPPAFDRLPGVPYLPDPLRFADGHEVQSPADWLQRRQELRLLFQRFVLGKTPPSPPAWRLGDRQIRHEGGLQLESILLTFGPDYQAKLSLELMIPPGSGPFPVFMTQDSHRAWALMAASRGYMGCVYAADDERDDTDGYARIWPQYDWSKLTRRAWAASRGVDYLHTLSNVDRQRLALAGHGHNGQQALIAGFLDDRFTAIISSSSGAGGVCSFRLFSESQFGEGLEIITRTFPDGFHPRLRFFAGRENKLPIDQHELVAGLAPRPCLISSALNDPGESIWSVEQTYYSAQRVYTLLGAGAALDLRYRPGGHEIQLEDIEAGLDWLDTKFGRGRLVVGNSPLFPTYADWLKVSGERIDPQQFPLTSLDDLLSTPGGNVIGSLDQWQTKRADIRQRIAWGLGTAPPYAGGGAAKATAEPGYLAALLDRGTVPAGFEKRGLQFGQGVAGDLYLPTGLAERGEKIPAVIWLPPSPNPLGYVAGHKRGEAVHLALARQGVAVLAFDPIGSGRRQAEASRFYQRYPHWSWLGKTVQETSAAVEALSRLPFIDARRIVVLGYATGAMAGLHAAALDDRIAGVVAVAGLTLLRLDTPEQGTGGVSRWAQWLPWQPRLGAFVGFENRIPYDYHEVLAAIAPRPVLIVAPTVDYQNPRVQIQKCLSLAGKVYEWMNSKDNLALFEVEDYNHFSPEMQQKVHVQLRLLLDRLARNKPTF